MTINLRLTYKLITLPVRNNTNDFKLSSWCRPITHISWFWSNLENKFIIPLFSMLTLLITHFYCTIAPWCRKISIWTGDHLAHGSMKTAANYASFIITQIPSRIFDYKWVLVYFSGPSRPSETDLCKPLPKFNVKCWNSGD